MKSSYILLPYFAVLLFLSSCGSGIESVDITKLDELDEDVNPELLLKVRLGHEVSEIKETAESNGAFAHKLKYKGDDGWTHEVPDGFAYKPYSDMITGRLHILFTTIDGKEILTGFRSTYYNEELEFVPRLLTNQPSNPYIDNKIVDLSDYEENEILGLFESSAYKSDKFPQLNKEDVERLCDSFIEKYGKTTASSTEGENAVHTKYSNGMYKSLEWHVGYVVVKVSIDDFCPDSELDADNCGYRLGGYTLTASYEFAQEIKDKIEENGLNKLESERQEDLNTNF
jgi:hypothetical protein